ncbi:hypothetical protein EGW08_022931 [Elysia chlorotica]|uniref:Centromere/kinetochore protein zw10 homolog n=1 Tax=Elysia chlorotica TaxID=188477 RepID=A0A433SJQ9_ELYCH|nr:hypothetical protein EGW08_022931 [Elysia chlorotica]
MTIEVHQLAESKYLDFKPNLGATEKLEARASDLKQEISDLENKINNKIKNQLSFSAGEFQDLNSKLAESKLIYEGLEKLTMITSLLQESERCMHAKQYSQAASSLSEVEKMLKCPLTSQDAKISILAALATEVKVRKGQLDCLLTDLWKEFVQWNIKAEKNAPLQQQEMIGPPVKVSLCVSCEGNCHSELRNLVIGLHKQNLLNMQMKTFVDRFKKFIVPLIVEYPVLDIEVLTAGTVKTLVILRKEEAAEQGIDKAYASVFSNLIYVMTELSAMLLDSEFDAQDTDNMRNTSKDTSGSEPGSVDRGDTMMSWLGAEIGPWLLDQLQRTVIAKAVPTSSKDMDGFEDVIVQVTALHEKLVEIGFIQADNQILLKSVENVNMLFSNKKSQTILVEARKLMISGLHEGVAVTDDKPMGEWPPLTPGGVKKVQRLEVATNHQLSDNTLRMPRCRISESIQTLVSLAYETLQEATESSPECALQMFLAVNSMFEIFCEVVPTHHGKTLETFPQVAALHHNNCMFISHHLLTLGHQFATRLPPIVNPTFVSLIQQIRENGVEVFLAQIQRQKNLLLDCLEGAKGFAYLEEKARGEAAGRAVKQVLLQLDHLQKIWKPVLPINNYKKAMGRLIGCVVTHITDCVCALEDIAQTAGQTLLKLLSPLESTCGEMLVLPGEAPPVELARHVEAWPRLAELQLVLDASLLAVGDRWAGGQGPLALAFTPAEVRQLVRALFQNTDRRANLLATIK